VVKSHDPMDCDLWDLHDPMDCDFSAGSRGTATDLFSQSLWRSADCVLFRPAILLGSRAATGRLAGAGSCTIYKLPL